jgi:hypothetical protein
MHEAPNGPIVYLQAALAEFDHKTPQGEVRSGGPLAKKDGMVAQQDARPVATHLPSRSASGRPQPLRPLHDTRHAHAKRRRNRSNRFTRQHASDNPLTKIKRIGLGHPCWPPIQPA